MLYGLEKNINTQFNNNQSFKEFENIGLDIKAGKNLFIKLIKNYL